jgi:hypothetical protein
MHWSKVRPQYAFANRDGREMAPEWTLDVMGKGATDPVTIPRQSRGLLEDEPLEAAFERPQPPDRPLQLRPGLTGRLRYWGEYGGRPATLRLGCRPRACLCNIDRSFSSRLGET